MPPETKLLAEWFWTDRWMGSSAFLLPIEQRGLYREMLSQAWRRGAQLPNNHEAVRRAIGATVEEWERCWPVIEHYWFVDADGYLKNETQLKVYAKALAFMHGKSEQGKRGAAARWNGNGRPSRAMPGNTRAMPSDLRSPSETLTNQESHTRADALRGFDAFWSVFPKKKSRAAAERAWLRNVAPDPSLHQRILGAIAAQRKTPDWQRENGRFVPYPATWLNGRRWEDAGDEPLKSPPERPGFVECAHEPRCNSKVWCATLQAREAGLV